MSEPALTVTVALSSDDGLKLAECTLPAGATVADALAASGFTVEADRTLGIFGKRVDRTTPLAAGDRVEIYRPIQCDPKAMRHARVARQREG